MVWQMSIISIHMQDCDCMYLCVQQYQHYASGLSLAHYILLAYYNYYYYYYDYFSLLDQVTPIMRVCWYILLECALIMMHYMIK